VLSVLLLLICSFSREEINAWVQAINEGIEERKKAAAEEEKKQ